jgi:signal transduction histidine kinase
VSVEREFNTVRLCVRDEGPGLSEDDRLRAFRPFQKLSALPTGDESSTGLGLSIVKQIVDLHHGRINVDSKPGTGSTFVVELAATEAELRRAVA